MNTVPARSVLVVVVVAAFVSGCFSTASYHTAEPIEEGTKEIGVALEADRIVSETPDDVGTFFQHPRVNARYGISEQADVGVTAGNFGFGTDLNYLLADDESIAISYSPYLGIMWFAASGDGMESSLTVTHYHGLHFDLAADEDLTLTGALKPGFFYDRESNGDFDDEFSNDEFRAMIGGSVGMRIDLEDAYIFPELNLFRTVGADEEDFEEDYTVLKFGVGVGF